MADSRNKEIAATAAAPRLIGLTGLYCAGKNFAQSLFEKRGIPVIDVDKLGHKALELRKADVAAVFGGILDSAGNIDRKKLGALVFGSPRKMSALESIVHPEVNRLIEKRLCAIEGQFAVINAALLHKCARFSSLERIVIVRAPFILRLLRAKKRDNLPLSSLIKRLMSQKEIARFYTSLVKKQNAKTAAFSSNFSAQNADNVTIELSNCGVGFERKLKAFIDSLPQ